MPMRVLITGRGSIAQRHVRHLRGSLPEVQVGVVSGNGDVADVFRPCSVFADADSGLAWQPDAVIIAGISSRHARELERCLQLKLPCLAEKPLVTSRDQWIALRSAAAAGGLPAVVVGCNLRYLPALGKLRCALASLAPSGRVLRAQFEVGQELSQWRPGRDLQSSYSAHAGQGGGVVFDLVHEIDMARWLLAPFSALHVKNAVGGHLGDLPISSDDVHTALLQTASGAPVVVSLDYVSQQTVRRYAIVTTAGTYEVDLVAKNILLRQRGGETSILTDEPADFDVSATYGLQMRDWLAAIADRAHDVVSPLEDALQSASLMLDMKEAAG
ncbi:MAG: Gfo/Idh/MocA family oxidoreductase [Comamonadaceae bacterium]|nr:MAG: Gfo/Idh/MocA family oxidoreductase [Comamonadaceae bacterium]